MATLEQEIAALDAQSAEPGFWDDARTAQAQMRRLGEMRNEVSEWRRLQAQTEELAVLEELAADDEELAAELVREGAKLQDDVETLGNLAKESKGFDVVIDDGSHVNALTLASFGILWPFAAMHQREVLAAAGGTLSDTMHVVLGGVTVFLMFLAIGFGATAFGKRFRFYSIASIVVLLAFGTLTFLDAPRLQANLPTPWIGLWERINISVFLLWVVVLATVLLKKGTPKESHRAKFLAAYNAALKLWPVPYEELDIPTRFGKTHVVAAGPKDAPALVLLHGYMATSVMWAPNIADVSGDYRVYAIDVMGQPSKSVPDDPIRNATDYVAWLTATLDGLGLSRVSLVGMSFGGWIALRYAVAAPDRIQRLVLLSPGGFLPMAKQFGLRVAC